MRSVLARSTPTGGWTTSRAQGYVLGLDALGCGVDQKAILRIKNGPNRVEWELYGTGHTSIVTPTVNLGGGARGFTVSGAGLLVEGVINSFDATEADVDFNTVEFDSISICDEDNYLLAAE